MHRRDRRGRREREEIREISAFSAFSAVDKVQVGELFYSTESSRLAFGQVGPLFETPSGNGIN